MCLLRWRHNAAVRSNGAKNNCFENSSNSPVNDNDRCSHTTATKKAPLIWYNIFGSDCAIEYRF